MSKIFLTITIDVEPDCSRNWSRSTPLTYKSVTHGIPHVLQPLFNRYSAKPTYFLSPEVIEHDDSVRALSTLNGRYELGIHLHPEFTAPAKEYDRYDGVQAMKFACYDYSDDIEFRKLENLTEDFKRRFGYRPLCYRAGRFGADIHTVRSLSQLGYLVDSSVTPHIDWGRQGGPDFREFPAQPYFIDPDNFTKELAGSKILEVPVTIGGKRLPFLPDHWLFYNWLRPTHMSVWEQKKLIEQYIRTYKEAPNIIFCMMFHSMEIIPGASPYARNQQSANGILSRLNSTLKMFQEMKTEFVGLIDISNLLEQFNEKK